MKNLDAHLKQEKETTLISTSATQKLDELKLQNKNSQINKERYQNCIIY